MIRFKDVTFSYGLRRPVLKRVSLEIPEGSRLHVTGPSGCGKTTFIRLLLGLEKPRKGVVTGTENTRFSVVFQEDRLIESRSVLHNVLLFSDEETAKKRLTELGLSEEAQMALPKELSGGMRRRVAIARALARPFDVLVLDEPTTGLDRETAEMCLAVIDRVVADKTLVLVSHDSADGTLLRTTPVVLAEQQNCKV